MWSSASYVVSLGFWICFEVTQRTHLQGQPIPVSSVMTVGILYDDSWWLRGGQGQRFSANTAMDSRSGGLCWVHCGFGAVNKVFSEATQLQRDLVASSSETRTRWHDRRALTSPDCFKASPKKLGLHLLLFLFPFLSYRSLTSLLPHSCFLKLNSSVYDPRMQLGLLNIARTPSGWECCLPLQPLT